MRFRFGEARITGYELFRDGHLAVVDFDDAAAGDPYADLGALLAALPHDAPQLFASPALARSRRRSGGCPSA